MVMDITGFPNAICRYNEIPGVYLKLQVSATFSDSFRC